MESRCRHSSLKPGRGAASHPRTALFVCLAGVLLAPVSARGGDEKPASPPVAIEVSPRSVRTGAEVRLEALVRSARPTRYVWRVDHGELLSADSARVWWQAPARPGEVEIVVEVEAVDHGGGERRFVRRRTVRVQRTPTTGMVRIPGGVYTIGDTWTDYDDPLFVKTNQNMADKPPHKVDLSPFRIDRDRVTNEQFVAYLREAERDGLLEVTPFAVLGPHQGAMVPFFRFSYGDLDRTLAEPPRLRRIITHDGNDFRIRKGHERHPVVDVTWPGAHAFARYRGKRLPTSAEWEVAARGVDGRRFPWGNDLPTPKHANVNMYHGDRLFPVGSFSPLGDSPFGVRDMVGGVFEWVNDWYGETYYFDIYSRRPVKDPQGPHWGRDHVIRGVPNTQGLVGSVHEQPPLSFRYSWFFETPEGDRPLGDGFANGHTGFRTALDAGPASE